MIGNLRAVGLAAIHWRHAKLLQLALVAYALVNATAARLDLLVKKFGPY